MIVKITSFKAGGENGGMAAGPEDVDARFSANAPGPRPTMSAPAADGHYAARTFPCVDLILALSSVKR
jgi:hypothetical protein